MAGGIVGDLINGALWGAGTSLAAAAAFGFIVGSLAKSANLDDKTIGLIREILTGK